MDEVGVDMSRGVGAACVGGDVGARAGTAGAMDGIALDVGSDGPATVSVTLSRLATCPTAPSLTTIAPSAKWRPTIRAMCAIAPAAGLNDEHTQHRP